MFGLKQQFPVLTCIFLDHYTYLSLCFHLDTTLMIFTSQSSGRMIYSAQFTYNDHMLHLHILESNGIHQFHHSSLYWSIPPCLNEQRYPVVLLQTTRDQVDKRAAHNYTH
jgi:hypothetical protein